MPLFEKFGYTPRGTGFHSIAASRSWEPASAALPFSDEGDRSHAGGADADGLAEIATPHVFWDRADRPSHFDPIEIPHRPDRWWRIVPIDHRKAG